MNTEIYWIRGPWPGRVGIVPRPRGGDWLEDEVRAWRDNGVDEVVSLLTPGEEAEFLLRDEANACRLAGLKFQMFPIRDRGVPTSRADAIELIADLEKELQAGRDLVVHCRQGIGRSSLVVASLLAAGGVEPGRAFQEIQAARGRPVPDTEAQKDWVRDLAAEVYATRDRG